MQHALLSADDDPAVSPRLAAVGGAALLAASAAVALWSGLLADGEGSALAWLVVLASCTWSLALLASTRWRVPAGCHMAAALAAASVTSARSSGCFATTSSASSGHSTTHLAPTR